VKGNPGAAQTVWEVREVTAVILDPAEILTIITCLARNGRGPPTRWDRGGMTETRCWIALLETLPRPVRLQGMDDRFGFFGTRRLVKIQIRFMYFGPIARIISGIWACPTDDSTNLPASMILR
jgi:hypothetical protein